LRNVCPLCGDDSWGSLREGAFRKCFSCELVWSVNPERVDYRLGEDAKWIEERLEVYKWLNRLNTEMVLKRLNVVRRPKFAVLDIGAGKSQHTLRQIRERRRNWDLVAADFYTDDDMLEARSHRIDLIDVSENLFAWAEFGERFDVIICSHTLEHIIDLSAFVEHLGKALDGDFFGIVPMFPDFRWDVLEMSYNREHVQMFHEDSIEVLGKKLGRSVKEIIVRDTYDCFFWIGGEQ